MSKIRCQNAVVASRYSAATKYVEMNAGGRLTFQSLPLEGESQKPSRPLSRCPEPAKGLSKGGRRLMQWGDSNTIPCASSMINFVCILR